MTVTLREPPVTLSALEPQEIERLYKVRDLFDLSGMVFSAQRRENFTLTVQTDWGGQQQVSRSRWDIPFSRGTSSYTTSLEQSLAENEVAPLDALHCVAGNLRDLFGWRKQAEYSAWRAEMLDTFGKDAFSTNPEAISRANYHRLLYACREMQSVLGGWFPVLLYGKDDI